MTAKPRVFIGLCEIAGFNGALKAGFDELGVSSGFYDLSEHSFRYSGATENNWLIRNARFFNRKATECSQTSKTAAFLWMLCYYCFAALLLLVVLPRFDTFVFSFGKSFLRYYDLPVLKLFRKQVVFVYLGSDSRPPYLNRKYYSDNLAEIAIAARKMKQHVRTVEKYADYVIDHPPAGHFHEKPFVQFLKIGIPTRIEGIACEGASDASAGVVRILHAPSSVEAKGTSVIRQAIENLKRKGYRIEYCEIINRPNSEVLQELSRCDFIVDELYSDTLMARFAAEAAFFSKPAIVGGYAGNCDFGHLAPEEYPPVHRCAPDAVESAIEELIVNTAYRKSLGMRAKQFLTAQWDPRVVAGRFVRLINNDVPDDWYFEPAGIRYVHGWGSHESQVRSFLHDYVQCGGGSALQVGDKPDLEKQLLLFAGYRGLL